MILSQKNIEEIAVAVIRDFQKSFFGSEAKDTDKICSAEPRWRPFILYTVQEIMAVYRNPYHQGTLLRRCSIWQAMRTAKRLWTSMRKSSIINLRN